MNSPYYAIHFKDTSQDEVPGVIVDHLDNIMNGGKSEKFGDYFLQVDGNKSINYKLTNSIDGGSRFNQDPSGYYYYLDDGKNNEYIYYFDENMSIIESNVSINDGLFQSYQITSREEAKVREELNELISPLLKRVNEPIINLQWLYDFIFREY